MKRPTRSAQLDALASSESAPYAIFVCARKVETLTLQLALMAHSCSASDVLGRRLVEEVDATSLELLRDQAAKPVLEDLVDKTDITESWETVWVTACPGIVIFPVRAASSRSAVGIVVRS